MGMTQADPQGSYLVGLRGVTQADPQMSAPVGRRVPSPAGPQVLHLGAPRGSSLPPGWDYEDWSWEEAPGHWRPRPASAHAAMRFR